MFITPAIVSPYVPQTSAARFAARARETLASQIGNSSDISQDAARGGTYLPGARRHGRVPVSETAGNSPRLMHFVYALSHEGGRRGAKKTAQTTPYYWSRAINQVA